MYFDEETVKKNVKVLKDALAEDIGSSAMSEYISNSDTLKAKELVIAVSALMDTVVSFLKEFDEMRDDQKKLIQQQEKTMELIRDSRCTTN